MPMRSACCGCKLRTASLIFLYLYLINTVYGVFGCLTKYQIPEYREILENYPEFIIGFGLSAIAFFVYLVAVINVHKEKTFGLTAAAVMLAVMSAFLSIETIIMNVNGGFVKELWKKESEKLFALAESESDLRELKRLTKATYSTMIFGLNATFVVQLCLNIYVILILISYKKELEEKYKNAGVIYQPPAQQYVVAAPNPHYPPYQYAGSPYAPTTQQYSSPPPQYPSIPPECQVPPQPYAPYQFPNVPYQPTTVQYETK